MKPEAPRALANFAGILRTTIAPQLEPFSAGSAGMIAAMMDMMAEEWDRAASRLVEENAAIRRVLAKGAALLPESADDTDDGNLRISALEAQNERLRARLIDLHVAVEQAATPEASALENEIWAVLARSVELRRVSLANF